MSIRFGTKNQFHSVLIMFSRCMSSIYRSLSQVCPRKRYHLLTNSILLNNNTSLRKILYETFYTLGLSLFLLYLFYQLSGSFILIALIILGILCKHMNFVYVFFIKNTHITSTIWWL